MSIFFLDYKMVMDYFFLKIKMRYINNGGETLLVQDVLKEPPRKTTVQTSDIQASGSVDPQTK
jgi:hypothetical protein